MNDDNCCCYNYTIIIGYNWMRWATQDQFWRLKQLNRRFMNLWLVMNFIRKKNYFGFSKISSIDAWTAKIWNDREMNENDETDESTKFWPKWRRFFFFLVPFVRMIAVESECHYLSLFSTCCTFFSEICRFCIMQ